MRNLGNVYICGSPFVMNRTDAQNGLDSIFKFGMWLTMLFGFASGLQWQWHALKRFIYALCEFYILQYRVDLLRELSSSHSFGRGFFFFAQDLVSHAATLNPDQSKQIVNACDYLFICDYLIGVQWLIRLPALRAGVQWLIRLPAVVLFILCLLSEDW
jgi:hypothetical protein